MSYNYNDVISRIHPDWLPFFEANKKELINILNNVNECIKDNKIVFPKPKQLFRTLFYFGPNETKLVLLGQDPYIGSEIHNENKIPQACGFSFSVPKKHKIIPPSLNNIFKEIKSCYPDFIIPKHGFLHLCTLKTPN
jgi:uracil-DNA glycosylase